MERCKRDIYYLGRLLALLQQFSKVKRIVEYELFCVCVIVYIYRVAKQ